MNNIAKYTNSANNGAGLIEFSSLGGRKDEEYKHIDLEISRIFAMHNVFSIGTRPFHGV